MLALDRLHYGQHVKLLLETKMGLDFQFNKLKVSLLYLKRLFLCQRKSV